MSRTRILASTAGLLVVALVIALVALTRLGGSGTQFTAMFDNTVGVYSGSDVRVLGVKVGRVGEIVPQGDAVRVTLLVDEDVRIAADSGAVAISPSLVSDRYIQLSAAKRGAGAMAGGATIPRDRTATPVELDRMYAAISEMTTALGPNGANKDGALSRLLTVADQNLDGNGAALNDTITEFGQAAKALQGSQEDLTGTITNLKSFNDTLVRNDDGIGQVNAQLASVSGYLADDREDLAAAVAQLGEALAQVQGFIKDNRAAITTDVQGLQSTAQTLAEQKKALEQITASLPVVLQNFLDAYDPATGTISSRGNLNEIGVGASGAGGASAGSSAAQSRSAVPSSGAAAGSGAGSGSAADSAGATGSGLPMFLPVVTP